MSGSERNFRTAFGARLWRTASRLPVFTREGRVVAFLVMSLTTGLLVSGHLLLYFALAVALALLVIGFVYPFLNMSRIFVRRSIPPFVFAGEPVYVELAVANRKGSTPTFSLILEDDTGMVADNRETKVHVPVVGAGRAQRTGYYLNFSRRGSYRWRYIKVSSSFPFLMFERRQLIRFPSELVVYPRPGRLRRPVLPYSTGSLRANCKRSRGYQDFHQLREYRPGDDYRFIHWKSTARHGDLLLREFDAEGGESVLIVLDPQPEGSLRYGAKQDLAISFVITLIRALWRESYRVTFACHGEEFFQIELAHRRADFHMLLRHLAEYHSRGQQSLKGLIERVRVSRQRQMSMILVTDRVSVGAGEFEQAWTGSEGLRVISTNDPGFGALFQTTQGMVRW